MRLRTAALAASLLALTGCSSPKINEDMTDVEALAAEEAFVADTIAELADFPGFVGRKIVLESCYYGMNEDKTAENGAKVKVTYFLPEDMADDPAAVEDLALQFEEAWLAQGHTVERDLQRDGTLWAVQASDGTAGASFELQGVPRVEAAAGGGCVLIADGDFVVPDPLGGVTAENDDIENSSPRTDLE